MFLICLTREGLQAIPETIIRGERQGYGRQTPALLEQLGHISKFCPKKDPPNAAAATVATGTVATTVSTATINSKTKITEKELDHTQPKKGEDGWIEVIRKKKEIPEKSEG